MTGKATAFVTQITFILNYLLENSHPFIKLPVPVQPLGCENDFRPRLQNEILVPVRGVKRPTTERYGK